MQAYNHAFVLWQHPPHLNRQLLRQPPHLRRQLSHAQAALFLPRDVPALQKRRQNAAVTSESDRPNIGRASAQHDGGS